MAWCTGSADELRVAVVCGHALSCGGVSGGLHQLWCSPRGRLEALKYHFLKIVFGSDKEMGEAKNLGGPIFP